MAALDDGPDDLVEGGGSADGDHIGTGGHDLRDGRVVEFDDRFDHLAFVFIDDAAFFAFFDCGANFVFHLLLNLLGLGSDIHACDTSY